MRASLHAMSDDAVELTVAGQTCKVVTTASPEELTALAAMVEAKLDKVLKPGRPVTTQAMLLAAVALANDVREQQARADAIAAEAKRTLTHLIGRVDAALAGTSDDALVTRTKGRKKKSKSKSRGYSDEPR